MCVSILHYEKVERLGVETATLCHKFIALCFNLDEMARD